MNKLSAFALAAIIVFSCLSNAQTNQDFSKLPVGERFGGHNMVVYGAGPYFLDHIPMLMDPHDFQVITEVTLTDEKGNPIVWDFSITDDLKRGFVLQPSKQFSLNDYIAGRITTEFTGTIHDGENGPTIIKNVRVKFKSLKFARQVPAASNDQWFEVTDGKNVFQSNIITATRNKQLIENKTTGKTLWCALGDDFFNPCP